MTTPRDPNTGRDLHPTRSDCRPAMLLVAYVLGIAGVSLAGIVGFLVYHNAGESRVALDSVSWPAVDGVVAQRYWDRIVYQYTVADIVHNRYRIRWGFTTERTARPYRKGQRVRVYYEPADPSNSVLLPGWHRSIVYGWVGSAALAIVALSILATAVASFRRWRGVGHQLTRKELDDFLRERPPRQVPANIRRQRIGFAVVMCTLLGPCLSAGAAFTLVELRPTAEYWNESRRNRTNFVMLNVLLVGLTIGGVGLAGGSQWYRKRRLRLLRHGVATDARLEAVEPTNVTVNNQPRFQLWLRFDAGGESQRAAMNIYGTEVVRAREALERGESVRVLYDPDRPARVLWAELLVTT